jgi:Zn-dependent protease
MPASIRLGSVAGVPIGLHYSWFIIAALITFSLASHFRARIQPADHARWTTSLATAVLFFVTLLMHELSHVLVAGARAVPVRSITLFALGGGAQIEKDVNTAKTEFLVGAVGPVTSFIIGLMCIAIAQSLGWSIPECGTSVAGAVLGWLGSINILLAAFNLVPGYPLDGGRILRSILWGIYKDADRATRHAAHTGQLVTGALIVLGLFQFFAGRGFGGLWLAFIGWFLMIAAQDSYARVTVGEMLRGVRVADVMGICATVDAEISLQSLVDGLFLRTGRRCIVVKRDGNVVGLLPPHEVGGIERSHTPATEAFTTMAREDVNQLPVVADGRLAGVVTRAPDPTAAAIPRGIGIRPSATIGLPAGELYLANGALAITCTPAIDRWRLSAPARLPHR